jgi:hypothetical protein
MSPTKSGDLMSLKLLEVAERAQRDPERRLQSLAYLIDEHALERAYRRPVPGPLPLAPSI